MNKGGDGDGGASLRTKRKPPPPTGNDATKRRQEVEKAWEYSDWSAWCWVMVCIVIGLFILIVLSPPATYHPYYRGGYHGGRSRSHHRHHHHHHDHGEDDEDDGGGEESSSNHYDHHHHDYYNPPYYNYGYYPFYSFERLDNSSGSGQVSIRQSRISSAAEDLPVIDSDSSTVWSGHVSNKGYEGCITDLERTQLDEAAKNTNLDPKAKILLDERSGQIEFILDVPYVARDGAFVASFEPMPTKLREELKRGTNLLHSPGTCQSYGGSFDHVNAWDHAPNALYTDAFNRSSLYRNAKAEWNFYPLSCSRFSMHLSTSPEHLASCRNSDKHTSPIAFSATDAAVSVSGTLWLHRIEPSSTESEGGEDVNGVAVKHRSWPFSFSLYIDQYESKAAVTDVPSQEYTRAYNAISSDSENSSLLDSNVDVSAVDKLISMHAKSTLQWITRTSIGEAWFDPEKDGKDSLDTELHKERALRLRMVSRSTSPYELFEEATSGLHKQTENDESIQTTLLDAARRISAPRYSVIGFDTFFNAKKEVNSLGRFRVTEADFVDNSAENVECTVIGEDGQRIVECLQNWTIVLVPLSASSAELYQGAFEIKLQNEKTANGGDASNRRRYHLVRLDVAITDPSTDLVEVEQVQTEITSHLNDAATRQIHETAFVGGNRVCMQTYAMGPPQMMKSIDVRTIAAWLCVDDSRDAVKDPENKAREPENPHRLGSKTLSKLKKERKVGGEEELSQRSLYLSTHASAKSGCSERHHSIQLFGRQPVDTELSDRELAKSRDIVVKTYQPVVHEPGAYGSWSSALCFNISTVFFDERGNSVHRKRYYFQSEVIVMPTEKRRDPTFNLHRTFSSFERAAHQSSVRHDQYAKSLLISPSVIQLTSPQLGELLNKLDSSKKLDRFHTAKFDVDIGSTRKESHLYHINQATDISIFFIIIISSMCIVAATYGILSAYYSNSDNRKSKASTGSSPYRPDSSSVNNKPLRT